MTEEREKHQWLFPSNRNHPSQQRSPAATASLPSSSSDQLPQHHQQDNLAKRRAINLIHSRRKREKRRLEENAMDEEHTKVKSDGALLLAEQARLQALLDQAQTRVSSFSQ
jgi:hypothetical protein